MLPAYSLPEFRTIDSDRSRLVDMQPFKPAASRRSVIRFIERPGREFAETKFRAVNLRTVAAYVRRIRARESCGMKPTNSRPPVARLRGVGQVFCGAP